MCRRCDNRSYDYETTGSCDDCLCWTALLLRGACPACLLFRREHAVATCPGCRRNLPIGAAGYCRLCQTAARSNGGMDPGEGVQLFIGGVAWAPRRVQPGRLPTSAPTEPAFPEPGSERFVQVRLRPLPVAKKRPAPAAQRPPRRDGRVAPESAHPLLAAAVGFGEARGWSPEVIGRVLTGLRILVEECGLEAVDSDAVRDLKTRGIAPLRILEFLRDQGMIDAEESLDAWLARRLEDLPATMRTEVKVWLDVLRGQTDRGGRPRSPYTVKAYVSILQPSFKVWSGRYESLREVTREECLLQLQGLQGSVQRLGASGMRSLFRSLKAQRLIFTNPALGIAVGHMVPRPVLALEPADRRQRLAESDAPGSVAVLLAGVHGLRSSEIAALTLDAVDFTAGTLLVRGGVRALDQLTLGKLRDWVEARRARWPVTANRHVLVNQSNAGGVGPVSRSFVQGLVRAGPVTVEALRRDGLLAQAREANGDPLTLAELFGLSHPTAIQYCRQVAGELDPAGV